MMLMNGGVVRLERCLRHTYLRMGARVVYLRFGSSGGVVEMGLFFLVRMASIELHDSHGVYFKRKFRICVRVALRAAGGSMGWYMSSWGFLFV